MTHNPLFPTLTVLQVFSACNFSVGQVIVLLAPEVVIGRLAGSEVEIQHTGVSRQHAIIRRLTGYSHIVDLASHNGTYLNHERLIAHESRPLNSDDEIQIGQLLTFRFSDPESTLTMDGKLITQGDLAFDLEKLVVYRNGQPLNTKLSQPQTKILAECLKAPGKVFTYDELRNIGWPHVKDGEGVSDGAIQTQISRLRKHLAPPDDSHDYLPAAYDYGYRFVPRQ